MLKKKAFYLILIGIVFSSCSDFNKMLRSGNSAEKLALADQYFAKGNYLKASLIYESMLEGLTYNPEVERIYFQVAECSYYMDDYFNAGFHYKSYFEYFPQGKYSELARFRHAVCGYRESLTYNLDPTYSKKSIENLQLFINFYPKSIYVDSCNMFMDLCRKKLEQKAYENAYLYFNIQNYKAAITAFKNFSKDFPETDKHSIAAFYIIKASYLLAENSVDAKKKERLEKVIFEFTELEYELKNTEYYEDAKNIKAKAEKLLVSRDFDLAFSLYKKENYEAAMIAFRNFADEFPEAEEHAKSVFYMLKSSYLMAKEGDKSERKTLFENVFETFSQSQNDLMNTAYYEDALEIKNDTERQIEKLSKN